MQNIFYIYLFFIQISHSIVVSTPHVWLASAALAWNMVWRGHDPSSPRLVEVGREEEVELPEPEYPPEQKCGLTQ